MSQTQRHGLETVKSEDYDTKLPHGFHVTDELTHGSHQFLN